MGKGYEDLSRRALIKLDRDFDQNNDAKLLQYLTEHGDEYEDIRPIEAVIDKTDRIRDTLSGSKNILKKVAVNEMDKVLDNVTDALKTAINCIDC